MAVAVREHLEGATLSSATITLNTGAGTQAADLLLVMHMTTFYAAAAMLTPSGGGTWQGPIAVARNDATNAPHIKAWWREVTAGGAQTVNVNHSNSDAPHHAHLLVLSGADTAAPVSGSGVLDNGFGTAQTAPSVTGSNGGLLMCGYVSDDIVTYTAPAGMTGFSSNNSFSVAHGAYEVLAASGATGVRTATSSAAKTHTALSVAIAPGAAAAVGRPRPPLVVSQAVRRASRW
jgi:hypothetical protein